MFKATKATDKIQDVIDSKYSYLDNSQAFRLIELLLSACESEHQALKVAEDMPIERDVPGGRYPLKYGQFRLDTKTLKWEILF